MQVTTPTRTHKPGTRGSRYAGNHFNQGHEPARHEVQGMQVTTPTRTHQQGHEVQGMQVTTPTRTHQSRTQGSRYAGNHFQPGHEPARHEPGTRGSRHAGNHTNQDTNQGHTNQDTRFKACR